ncbi:homeodomain-like transcriptional regulator [Tasmannia lanceolata]|uniref:homeodomain-like transcriptional regulator n=1 Tax=Tasmannia lanceolata TaxID=3420 RepID=UPI0040645820
MENDEATEKQDNGTKRKTHFQLKSLENFYSEEKYPSQKAMEDYAVSLKLTYKQVRGWFVERRRKDKRERELACYIGKASTNSRAWALYGRTAKGSINNMNKKSSLGLGGVLTRTYSKCKGKGFHVLDLSGEKYGTSTSKKQQGGREYRQRAPGGHMKNSAAGIQNSKQRKLTFRLQDVLPSDYILKRVFRKDGPPLGVEFDPLPAGAFGKRSNHFLTACRDKQRVLERRKVLKLPTLDSPAQQRKSAPVKKYGMGKGLMTVRAQQRKSSPVKKYGMGKGLMTVWQATNPNGGTFPTGVNFGVRQASNTSFSSTFLFPSKLLRQESKRSKHQMLAVKQRMLGKKLPDKRKPIKKRKVECNKNEIRKKPRRAECKLAIEGLRSQEQLDALTVVMDDEELELRELQAGPNPLTCSAHLATNGRHGCSLCKDLLARFPPQSVKMKQPLCTRPWDSSPEIVQKLFKVFRFLYTHAVAVDVCDFTLDEFAQAFQDKDSLLLGKIHVSLLKLFMSDVEKELDSGFHPRAAKDSRFLGFLNFVRHQELDVKFWNRSLNPLTWTEILRQVLVAAGFGSKQNSFRRGILNKGGDRMAKYGLRPGTLKGELFSILFRQGCNGMKVSELAKDFQIVELDLPNTADGLEHLISSTLSSDITLFEKISPYAYRLRPQISIGMENSQSDTEDSGSVDDDSGDSSNNSSSDDSDESDSEELDSAICESRIVRHKVRRKQKNNKLIEYAEIDESHSGEAWVLGLMEGEYSDLRIEEKLNALVALVDLTAAGPSIRVEDPVRSISESITTIQHRGSGAKIKRSLVNPHAFPKPSWDHAASSNPTGYHRSDGSRTKHTEALEESGYDTHPLQSICLGSDRRYNTYWLFLGPCNEKDPGHRRIYFESSEDGHWEVIDTEQAFRALLSVLDCRGTREANLLSSLEKREAFLCQAMADNMAILNDQRQLTRSERSDMDITSGDGSSPISDIDNNLTPTENLTDPLASAGAIILELGRSGEEKRRSWDRHREFDVWIWNSFYSSLNAVKYSKRSFLESLTRCESCHDLYWRDEKHCKTCHATFELDFDMEERYTIHMATCREKEDVGNIFPRHKVLPSRLQSLKAAVHAIEAVMPEGALVDTWRRSAHKLWVKRLRRTSSLPEFLQVLNDFVGAISEDWLCKCNFDLAVNTAVDEIIVFFPTIPQTTSSVALWLVKLDTLIAPYLERAQSAKTPGNKSRVKGRITSNR